MSAADGALFGTTDRGVGNPNTQPSHDRLRRPADAVYTLAGTFLLPVGCAMPDYDYPKPIRDQVEPRRQPGTGTNFSDPVSNMTNINYVVPQPGDLSPYGNGAMQTLCSPDGGSSERSAAPTDSGGGLLGAIGAGIGGFIGGLLGGRTPAFNREAKPCAPAPAAPAPQLISV